MKAHLQKHFTRAAAHHVAKSAHHAAMAEHFGKLSTLHKAKSDMGDTATLYQAMADSHGEMADEHSEMGAECEACAKAFAASRKADGDELQPLQKGLSVLTPERPGVRLIPRAGQPDIPAPAVDKQFEHLVKVEHGEGLRGET